MCNVCGRPLAIRYVTPEDLDLDPDDFEYDEDYLIELSGVYRTREWDTRSIFPMLCETCACCLDRALLKLKTDMRHREEILKRNTKLNAERREKLGTKG